MGFPYFAVLRGSSRPSVGTKGTPIPAVLGDAKACLLCHFTLWLIRPSVPVRTAPAWNFVARTRVSAFRLCSGTCTVSKASHSYTAAFDLCFAKKTVYARMLKNIVTGVFL